MNQNTEKIRRQIIQHWPFHQYEVLMEFKQHWDVLKKLGHVFFLSPFRIKPVLLLFVFMLTSACDPTYYARRKSEIESIPDVASVLAIFSNHKETDLLKFTKHEDRYGVYRDFKYLVDGSNASFVLSFSEVNFKKDKGGKAKLRYSQTISNETADHEKFRSSFEKGWPIVKKIEQDLIEQLKMKTQRDGIQEEIDMVPSVY